MKALKSLCLFLSLVYVAVAITGINALSSTASGVAVSHIDAFGRFWAVGAALALAAFAYGIHRRAPVVWKAGFLLLPLNYIGVTIEALIATYRAAQVVNFATFYLPSVLVVFGGAAVTIYWGVWWKRQRGYFYTES